MLLRPAVSEKYVTPSSFRSRSFQNEIQWSAYFLLSASSVRTRRSRLPGADPTRNACSSSGDGSRPQTSRIRRGGRICASETAGGSATLRPAQIGSDESVERRLPFRPRHRRHARDARAPAGLPTAAVPAGDVRCRAGALFDPSANDRRSARDRARASSFGICGSIAPVSRSMIRLRALLPGRTTAPSLRPPSSTSP